MSLVAKQSEFAGCAARLVLRAIELGFQVTFGESYRTPEQAALNAQKGKGVANSVHTLRLAVDLNLFKNGEYLTTTEDHRELGEWWEAQHPLARWGGRFRDANHYSFEHQGVR